MSMIERVARAIVEADASAEGLTFRELSRHMARAAIEAMREPTEAMIDAFACVKPSDNIQDADRIWRAMTDAALNERPS